MHVTWSWLTPDEGDAVPEDEMADRQGEFFSDLRDRRYGDGLLDLGGVVLANPLLYLVQSVCFKAVLALRAGQPFVFEFADAPVDVTFSPDGPDIVVTKGKAELVRFRAEDLLPALVDCGERFLLFLADAAASDARWSANAARMGQDAEAARAALGTPPPAA